MRLCVRCQEVMDENYSLKVDGTRYEIVVHKEIDKKFKGRVGNPKIAICPKCGEISIYIDHI